MERRFIILFAFFILVPYFQTSLASEQDDEDSLNVYRREVPYHQKFSTKEKMEKMRWVGSFTEVEKRRLIEFLDKQPGYIVASWTRVMKGDLNRDGQMEYIIEDLLISDPKLSSFGTQLVVVQKVKKGFDLIIVSPPTRGRTFGHEVRIDLIDFDHDDQPDIVVQERVIEPDPEDPKQDLYYTAIYRNNNMKFEQVYERDHNYDELKFKDLDNDGVFEILETVSEFPIETYQVYPKWRWINIYQWNGTKLEKANQRFLSFYLEQEKLYRSLLKEASAEVEKTRKRGTTSIWNQTEQAIKTYIDRIEKMKREGEQKPK